MKKLFFLLLLLPTVCSAQLKKVGIQVLDITNEMPINGFKVKLGSRFEMQIPSHNGYDYYHAYQLKDLNDTLYIQNIDYVIDALPIAYHDYLFEEDKVKITVYAKPYINSHFKLDLPKSLSYKTKNDSVTVKAFCSGYETEAKITLAFSDGGQQYTFKPDKYDNGFYFHRIAYDDLQNGVFEVSYDNKVDTFEFKADQWYQTQYLISKPIEPNKREYGLIQSYFKYVSETQKTEAELRRKHAQEKDSLTLEIYRLRGEVFIEEPPMLEEPEHEDVLYVNSKAYPKEGFNHFFEKLEEELPDHTENAGNITLELEVLKDGYVRCKTLHAMQGAKAIISEVHRALRKERWRAATKHGKLSNQKIILILDILPNKKSISQITKFEPEEGMVAVNLSTSETIRLEVGQKLYYQEKVHGSVGIWANATSDNSQVLKRVESHLAYDKVLTPGMTGDDSATRTVVFEAQKAGKTKLHLQKNFRGENRGKQSIKVIVK